LIMATSALQIVNMTLCIILGWMCIRWMLRHRDRWLYAVPIFLYAAHVALFYTARFLMPDVEMSSWSAILRSHGLIAALIVVIYALSRTTE